MSIASRHALTLLGALALHAIALPATAQNLTKVNVVLNFAADGGSTGFMTRSSAAISARPASM